MNPQKIINLVSCLRIAMPIPEGSVKLKQLKEFFAVVEREDFTGKVLRTQFDGKSVTSHQLTYFDPVLLDLVEIKAKLSETAQQISIAIPQVKSVLARFTGLLAFAQSNLTRKGGVPTRGQDAMEKFFVQAEHFSNLTGGIFISEPRVRRDQGPVVRHFKYENPDQHCRIELSSCDTNITTLSFDFQNVEA